MELQLHNKSPFQVKHILYKIKGTQADWRKKYLPTYYTYGLHTFKYHVGTTNGFRRFLHMLNLIEPDKKKICLALSSLVTYIASSIPQHESQDCIKICVLFFSQKYMENFRAWGNLIHFSFTFKYILPSVPLQLVVDMYYVPGYLQARGAFAGI